MGNLRVFTDKLEKLTAEGVDPSMIDPVDAFGGYVAIDKYADDNLARTQQNILWKTQLGQSWEDTMTNTPTGGVKTKNGGAK